jgi:hypothetical protein
MNMVFFSSDRLEVKRLGKLLAAAGIPCEVRSGALCQRVARLRPEAELWVRDDQDCSRAFLFCVECSAGFAKRPPTAFELDPWNEILAA